MSLDLALPRGDAGAMRSHAAGLRGLAGDLARQSGALRLERSRLAGAWSGRAAAQAHATDLGLSTSADAAAEAMSTAAAAVATFAEALEQAREEVLQLRRRQADADADLAHGLAVARRTEVDPLAHARAVDSLHDTHRSRVRALAAEHDRVGDDCDRAGLRLRRALEATRGPFVRGHRESLEDYYGGIIASVLGTLPVLSQHPDAVRALVWASMSSLPSASRSWRAAKLLRPWAIEAWRSRGAGPLPALQPTNVPWRYQVVAGKLAPLQAWLEADNVLAGAAGMRGQSLMSIYGQSGSLARFGSNVGWFRGMSVAGTAATTVLSGLNVAAQGNPVHAFQENGAGYVADVGETLFNGSVTAMLIAPNPVTATAVVVTGVVYVGAELYAHREQIAALATDGVRLAADVGRRGAEVAGDVIGTVDRAVDLAVDTAVGTVERAVDDAVDHAVGRATQVGSALNPFD